MRGAQVLALIGALMLSAPAPAREIVDMAGRHVDVPDVVRRVFVAHDPPAIFMTALAPDLLLGTPFSRSPAADALFPPAVRSLPVIGGAMRINLERLVALAPDVVIIWNMRGQPDETARQMQALGLPAVMVDAAPFSHYPAAFRFLGRLLHREARAEELAQALETGALRLQDEVADIPESERKRVYYADSVDGLKSQCAGFFRGEIVELSGASNALRCDRPDGMTASVGVNLEKLLVLDPDAVLARTGATARLLRSDAGWRALRAVRGAQVFAAPELPFNWVERPHSQFKLLAAQMFAHDLYPDRVRFDFAAETRAFYKTFYRMDLIDADVARLRK